MPTTFGDGVPNRGTSEMTLDQWNQAMRASDLYRSWMQQNGLPTDGRVQLSRGQQGAFEQYLLSKGIRIPAGMHIDQGGNLNQENKTLRNVGIGAAATAAALTGFGVAGMGPLSGLGGGGAGAGAASSASPAFGIGAANTGAWGGVGMTPAAYTAAGGAGALGAGAAGAAGAGLGAAGTGGAAGAIGAGMSAGDWLRALAPVGVAVGSVLDKPKDLSPNTLTDDPQLKELIEMMMAQQRKREPLNDSILAMANGLLPTQYQNGGRGSG